jgi:hypothetical protein
MSRECDPEARLAAARLQHANPGWLVMWGRHERRYWAFPLFRAAPGTIISAASPRDLLTAMRSAEHAAPAVHRPAARPAATAHQR